MSSTGGERVRILLVDDDPDIRRIAGDALEDAGFAVSEHADDSRILDAVRAGDIAAVVLDLGLPGRNGLDVLRELRSIASVPIIILTARGDEADRIVGLEMGADDYIVKPFSPRELAARVRTVLRRASQPAAPQAPLRNLDFGATRIDLGAREVTVDGVETPLTAREFDLLAYLASHPKQVFTREQLLDQVWGSSESWQSPATVNEHIYRLRQKLAAAGSETVIATLRGVGYRFEAHEPLAR